MGRRDPESNVDTFLEAWWKTSRMARRRGLLSLPFLVLQTLAVLLWGPATLAVMFAIFAWVCWPRLCLIDLRSRRKLCVVLWLRRFHRGPQSMALFSLWQEAARPWGQVLTLTDQDVRSPMTMKSIALIAVVWSVGMATFYFVKNATASYPIDALPLVVMLSVGGLMYFGYFVFMNSKRSVTRLRTLADIDRIDRRARRIRSDKLLLFSLGSATIQCPPDDNEIWRAAISGIVPKVSAVILDYGDAISSNVEWEVNEVLRICGPDRIVLAVPQSTDGLSNTPQESTVQMKIRALFGSNFAPEIVFYPQEIPRGWYGRRVEAIVRPLQRIIGIMTQGSDLAGRNTA